MRLPIQGEGSSFKLTAAFTNYLGEPVTMLSIKYRIDCLTNGQTVRDWTDVAPAEVVEIQVTPGDNIILNDSNRREKRQLTIVANDDSTTQFVACEDDLVLWQVANVLPGRSVLP